jgi:hypothetical protein
MIRRSVQAVGLVCGALLLFSSTASDARAQSGKKPSLSLKATPAVSFAPSRVVTVGELRGGSDDEELYCPSVEWEWDDGTYSSSESDCSPYEAGKSQIKRRFTAEHQYKYPGSYRIVLRLKKGSRVVAMANGSVQVRPGLGQP